MASHDWHAILRENEMKIDHNKNEHIYDEVDLKQTYSVGFWVGALSAFLTTVGLLALVGLYYNNWQLP